MPAAQPALLEKLRAYDTPTICNVIELFDVRPRTAGYMDGSISARFPEMPPMVGYAATATCRTAIQPRAGDAYSSLIEQVERFGELSGPAVVVFQDLDQPVAAATFGEIMCTTYQAFGATGLITSGAGRDLEQVRAIGFPVFTSSVNPSHGYIEILDVHVPVHVGGLVVYPNDLLHGDANGVTSIPAEIAADVADVAGEFVAAENVILSAMRRENVTLDTLREANAEVQALKEQLRRRVSRSRKDA
ncbi:MAG: RraA family protein [Chloroflexota bacterium]|nr:MAG: dimethylmenaquinone methyltransferase [Chloroflexota bacterium]